MKLNQRSDQYGIYVDVTMKLNNKNVAWRMRLIPAGTFMMGSPEDEPGRYKDETQREVTIERPFWMFSAPVIQKLYDAVMGKNTSHFVHFLNPVHNVSWHDAQEFCRLVNEAEPGLSLRLPTEAEWEYACRAGTKTAYNTGDTITTEQACFDDDKPMPVGSYLPNAWGLYDMHGNVWEWCQDLFEREYFCVARGGSWYDDPVDLRSAFRVGGAPADRGVVLGFRPVCDLDTKTIRVQDVAEILAMDEMVAI